MAGARVDGRKHHGDVFIFLFHSTFLMVYSGSEGMAGAGHVSCDT